MLNIYQWFYKNVWPLKWEWILVNYKEGKTLIYGTIWIWKSFLFFDAPAFWLYKNAQRTITNKDSDTWEVQVLFSDKDRFYLIIRKTKLTNKWKDSVKSYFYSIEKNKNFIDFLEDCKQKEVITKNNDILTLLNFNQIKLENLTEEFKQESQLQNALDSLLPHIEVFKSTISIWQESDNIFEVENSRRISILKSVFWLIWIDDAKEIINERKKDIYSMIKAKQDKENYQEKFDKYTENINNYRRHLEEKIEDEELVKLKESLEFDDSLKLDMENAQKINVDINKIIQENKIKLKEYWEKNEKFKNLKENREKLDNKTKEKRKEISQINDEITRNLEKLENEKNSKKEKEEINFAIKKNEEKIKEISWKYEDLGKVYKDFLEQVNSVKFKKQELERQKKEISQTEKEIFAIENIIKNWNQEKLQNLKKEKEDLEKENELKIDFQEFDFQEYKALSINDLEKNLEKIKEKWITYADKTKDLKKQKDEILQNIENIKNELEAKNNEIECPNCGEKINLNKIKNGNYFEKQLQKLNENLKIADEAISTTEVKTAELRDYRVKKNISNIMKIIAKYWENENKIKEISQKLNLEEKQLEEISQNKGKKESLEKILEDLKKKNEALSEEIKDLEKNIDFKIEEDWQKKREITLKLEDDKKVLQNIETELQNFGKLQNIQENLKENKNRIEEEFKGNEKEINNLDEEIFKIEKELASDKSTQLQENEIELTNLKESISIFNNFIDDYNKNKLDLINLQKEFVLLKNLANIFWKELVIYVFQDRISALQDLINYFLEDVVDFKLNIALDEKGENLDIFVQDEKWKREVQSLSGWQKNALKIGWILWINKLNNSKMLFLDETINNFDKQSVHMISEKIKNFTEQNNLKFFMVTHSEILQQIDIWTEVLDLNLHFKI